ncbi:MAG: galactokinase [Solirubrobacteraceae bacterium]
MAPERTCAFAPGRVNLIGEHTDYNDGLALPFAIAEGVTVQAETLDTGSPVGEIVEAYARDLDEHDEFMLDEPSPAPGWRAFVRGTVAELSRAGYPLRGARLQIEGDVPQGSGLSSSAALEVSLCLALVELGSIGEEDRPPLDRTDIARLCARVENDWVGAHTGLLDQLASLYGAPDTALCIDFSTLEVDPVPLELDGWRLVILDSGERHAHASSGYNQRRAECSEACKLLGVKSLRQATATGIEGLPEPLHLRASHVLGENRRVLATVDALRVKDLAAVGRLLDESHESLRDRYQISTPAVEAAVQRLRRAGAAGARMVGGGFGGSILGLFAPDAPPPDGTLEVRPGPGAHLIF